MSVLQMKRTTSYDYERLLEATYHCTRRAGSAGDSRTSQRTSGERRLCDLSVRHGQHLLQMAALGRLQHDLTATSDDQLLVLGGHSASAAGRAIGDTVRTHRVCC